MFSQGGYTFRNIIVSIFTSVSCSFLIFTNHIQIFIGHVCCRSPIGLDGDGGHTVGDIEIGSLREDTAADGIEVFFGTLTVGKVVVGSVEVFGIGSIGLAIVIVGVGIGVIGQRRDAGNLPAGHHLVVCVVLGAHIVVVGQLHLVVVVVEAVAVHVGARQGDGSGSLGVGYLVTVCVEQLGTRGLVSPVVWSLDGYRQRPAQLAAVVASHRGTVGCIGSVGVDDGGIIALGLEDRIGHGVGDGAVGRLKYPFGHLVSIGDRACSIPSGQLLVAVQQLAIYLKSGQESVLDRQGTVVVIDCLAL